MYEKDINRFKHGDKYLKALLRPQLEDEVHYLNQWLPEYERYYNKNPEDSYIGKLIQEGRERLKILKVLLEKDLKEANL